VEVLASKPGRGKPKAAAPLKELGEHPDGGAMSVMKGRYGPYVKWGKVNATLPDTVAPDDLTPEHAIELVNAKAAKSGKKKPAAKKAAPKKTAGKPAAKKAAAKKPAAKKAPPRAAE